ncbi:MAG: bifunctional 5,10-methylenetetrahydrofolate dehydrogenase/5,10-methenyltetrahydrofolate cyclohydrolase [Candidatus Marinimicrobia bacterium]|nr:bifunctional 5,10-methylenetetrahydrofolate dehydrogenase/5,10-methenyltetrahydrofolate cyclohydrolase [Candidatus Neomarinimicrobiota bacterium]MBL7022772.1 bifunctional 5,10-methylenetetrahydrofolate dehydrogenase/5,10-methenyltetrahydrofolate cyclohydrolase [Candidatus Neomarinimicrobiota bacterium]MBL7109707.1 bifunctional 5,10-methylenetetrahydrofolate dehydrogenase/5,10-methenyltetrahydrofolate cyclohydrolase [Candidatus Neomarinimicrobiota bacterium]
METKILKGKPVADSIKSHLSIEIGELASNGIIPGLAAVLVGNDQASEVYVRSKARAFEKLNCFSETFRLNEDAKEFEVISLIHQLNQDSKFHGILVQLPLPKHLDSQKILSEVSPKKDVDGFHPVNLGSLLEGNPNFIPCTPNGIIEILKYYKIKTEGKHAVIVGRSNIVGKPMFALLAQKMEMGNATVTICHTRTRDISYFTKQADIIIAASGVPELITGKMIKEGVDIIDVGINRVDDDSEKGYHLVGDVDFDGVQAIAGSVTPVPGGVGVMTITMLLSNTVKSAKRSMENC